ncbi:MAG: AAA family ATPase [Ignavibacteria bacterium]|nr:AAA family ATPase [Ignavibacteria bacterium]
MSIIKDFISEANSFTDIKCTDQTMNELLKSQIQIPKQLCGDFLFNNEVCIFFGSTGIGKTIFAFQIANNISKGINESPFTTEVGKQKVLYINLELTQAQIKKRYYKEDLGDYDFDDNLRLISNISYKNESELSNIIKMKIDTHKPIVVIIDNISFIAADKEKGENAKLLMKDLNDMKTEFNISILLIGHSPKVPPHIEIELRHLSGSANLSNFCDGVFAIAKSSLSSDLRYLKLLKNRGSVGNEKVFVFKLNADSNFLHFDFVGMDWETNHLKNMIEVRSKNRLRFLKIKESR